MCVYSIIRLVPFMRTCDPKTHHQTFAFTRTSYKSYYWDYSSSVVVSFSSTTEFCSGGRMSPSIGSFVRH